jgi:hypothetical protein
MPTINQLSGISQVSGGDLLPVYVSNNGDARKVSITQLLQYFQTVFASPTVSTNLYTPGTGFNITVPTPTSEQQWMLIQPAGTLASGTVTLPLNTGVPDGTQVLITTTQEITAFTLALNGAAAGFAFPPTLEAGAGFTVRYYQATNSWYNISAELSSFFANITVDSVNGLVLGLGSGAVASNISIGEDSLLANTTGQGNIAVGDSALKTNTIGIDNTGMGRGALLLNLNGSYNVASGALALALATGSYNTAIGRNAGGSITTGAKNTIIGNYSGNQGGLDISTASNYVVLSDGDGNPRAYWNGANATFNGDLTLTGTLSLATLSVVGALSATSLTTSTFTALSGGTNTIASATSITPVKSINFISGTAAIETIVTQPPITGANGTIILIPTGAFTWTTAGNIAIAGTAVVGKALHMTFSGSTSKWYPSYV